MLRSMMGVVMVVCLVVDGGVVAVPRRPVRDMCVCRVDVHVVAVMARMVRFRMVWRVVRFGVVRHMVGIRQQQGGGVRLRMVRRVVRIQMVWNMVRVRIVWNMVRFRMVRHMVRVRMVRHMVWIR